MDFNKSITFIVPSYNAENTIEECLNKIFLESKKFDSEIIVIDDCSTDNTASIVSKFKEVKLFKLKSYSINIASRP